MSARAHCEVVGFRKRCTNRGAEDRVNLAETWIGCVGGCMYHNMAGCGWVWVGVD